MPSAVAAEWGINMKKNIFFSIIALLVLGIYIHIMIRQNSADLEQITETSEYHQENKIPATKPIESNNTEKNQSNKNETYIDNIYIKLNSEYKNREIEIVDNTEFYGLKGKYALIELNIGDDFANRYYLYSVDHETLEFVPAYGIVSLKEIINENELLFINSSGESDITSVLKFPHLVRCIRISDSGNKEDYNFNT